MTNKTEKIIEDIKREIRSVKYSEGEGFDDFSHGFIKMNSLALEIIDKYSSGRGMCFNCYSKTDTCQEGLYCPMDMKGGVQVKKRTVDTTKKSNIKCEHCEHWAKEPSYHCMLTGAYKNYWNRCKSFEWRGELINESD